MLQASNNHPNNYARIFKQKHVDFAPNNEDMIRYVSAKLVSDQNMGM